MKVKESLNLSNKKKNALPSSKILKPKKFKPSQQKSTDVNNLSLSKDKLKLVKENITVGLGLPYDDSLEAQRKLSKKTKTRNKSLDLEEKTASLETSHKKSKSSLKESKSQNVSTLFDFDTPTEQNVKVKNGGKIILKDKPVRSTSRKSSEKNQSSEITHKGKTKENKTSVSDEQDLKAQKTPISHKQNKNTKVTDKSMKKSLKLKNFSENKLLLKENKDQNKENIITAVNKCKLKASKVADVTQGLLKLINGASSRKPEMLDVAEPIFLQVECIKIPICPTKQLRLILPHPLVDDTSDVLLITPDLRGHKIYPDKAVEHYEELLAKCDIDFINKVMPLRMLKSEYSQYEMKRKLVDQFDVILADCRIVKSLPGILGKFALYKRKMPIPVHLNLGEHKLKKHLKDAVSKTQMTIKSNGHCSVVQIGHSKMNAKDMAANIIQVAKSLENFFPGGWRNVRSLVVKTTKSTSLPVYLSLLSPNEVKIPVEQRRKPKPVEDELSTMPGYNVVVTANGNVILKKIEEDLKIDNSRDDEILEEAEKYLEAMKTVRYDESSDEEKNEKENSDSDDEGEAITEAMEKKLMNKYEKNAKAKKSKKEEDEDEEDEEEEEESEDESEIVPVAGKRKSQGTKKQSGPPSKKMSKSVEPKGKNKLDKSNDSKKTATGFKKPQLRGTRGGKKNKMSKDQRKALIKRKKAGKK